MNIECSFCNKPLIRQPNQIKSSKHHFCDRTCKADWQREHWTGKNSPAWKDRTRQIMCDYCGEQFERKQSAIQNSKNQFCSRKCKYDFQRENSIAINQHLKKRVYVECSQCGNRLERRPSQIEHNSHYFCNRKCFGKWKSDNWCGKKSPGWQGGKKRIIQCSQCGKSFERYANNRNPKVEFCNQECRRKWHSKNLVGKKSPHWKGGSVTVQCETCNKPLQRIQSEIRKREKFFCNKSCMGIWQSKYMTGENHPNWKGGWPPYYGLNWKKQRRKARKRDNYTCQNCGITENDLAKRLDVHHIKPFREFNYIVGQNENYKQANKMSNLISLCFSCHVKYENGKISK